MKVKINLKIMIVLLTISWFCVITINSSPLVYGYCLLQNNKDIEERKQLIRMTEPNKYKIQTAIKALTSTYLTSSVSTNLNEIESSANDADLAVNEAIEILPDGNFKGALIASNKAALHSFILRLANQGKLDLNNPNVTNILEEIILRYGLSDIPKYERSAYVLKFGKVYLNVIKTVSNETGIFDDSNSKGSVQLEQDRAEIRSENEAAAISNLRLIFSGESTYQAGVGDGNYGSATELFNQYFFDEELAKAAGVKTKTSLAGQTSESIPKKGYYFVIKYNKSRQGVQSQFTAIAIAAIKKGYNRTGNRNFFIDETGVIRFSNSTEEIPTVNSKTLYK